MTVKRAMSVHSFRGASGRLQRGLGLLEVMLFVAVTGSLATVGYLEWRARETVQTARQERAVLSQADTAVMTFATVNHRLPCPDTDRDGLEDCGGGAQKGWLPSTSLQLAGADPGVEVGQLRYLVQRGAASYDLAALTDGWRPLEYDDAGLTFASMRTTTADGGSYQAGILTLTDLCQRLGDAAGTALSGTMAQVSAAPARTVAYALAHPGLADADGDNSPFDGVNGAAGNTLEDPARALALSGYDDVILERSFASLQLAFECEPLIQSINTVALGLDVVAQVDDMREGNIESATRAVIFAGLGALITGVELGAAAIEAASDSGNAAAEFAACVASLGIAVNFCSAAPLHVSSAVTAGISAGLNGLSVIANVAAAVMAGNALALADSSSPPSAQTCPVIDVSAPLATTLSDLNTARAELTTLEATLLQRQADLVAANATRTASINALYAAVRGGGFSSALDGNVSQVINTASNWSNQVVSYDTAVNNRTRLQTTYNSLNNLVIRYDDLLANRATLIPQLEAEIAALDIQIAATPDGAAKDALRAQRNTKSGELGLLNNLTVLQSERATAVTDRAQALADLTAAQLAEAAALNQVSTYVNSYQGAYSTLNSLTAGPYWINIPPPLTAVWGCTPTTPPAAACPTPSVYTAANTSNGLRDLMGLPPFQSGASQPHADSKFMAPRRIQREIAAMQDQVAAARERVATTQTRYDEMLAQSSSPPACNITGTGVTPWAPTTAAGLLVNVDAKGGTR